jgi:tRNA(fMet)-specific endonuclease VapC
MRPPLYVIDTDTVIDVLQGFGSAVARLEAISPEDVAITAITVSELRYGVMGSRNPTHGLSVTAAFIDKVAVIPFTLSAALIHAELRLALRVQPIGYNDMIIAASTLAVPATLITPNVRQFSRVPGLEIESWR